MGVVCLIGPSLGGPCVISSCRPPSSVLGHRLRNRAAKGWHGTVGFSCSSLLRPADTLRSAPSRGGGQGNLATRTVAQDCVLFCFIFFVMHVTLFSVVRFQLGTSPPPGTAGCATFPFRVGFRVSLSRPRHAAGLRKGCDVGFPDHGACGSLQSPCFPSPPPPRW